MTDAETLRRLRLEELIGAIGEIADLEYQRRAWAGHDPKHRSSFADLSNTIFSDLDAHRFCKTDAKLLGIEELDRRRLAAFLKKLDEFITRMPSTAPVQTVQASADWLALSREGSDIVRILQRYAPQYNLRAFLGEPLDRRAPDRGS